MDRAGKAIALHDAGCNCAQSVACSFADEVDIDEKTIFRSTEGLGRGVGGLGGTCGALLGAASVAGMLTSDGEMHDPPTKKRSHELAAALTALFAASGDAV